MKNKPLVSIIITSYNYEQYIQKAIDSVLNQTYRNFEIWIIDGASTDSTVEILKSYKNKINWISEPDSGETEAMNKGLVMIKGELVNFLCADSYLVDDAIERAVSNFKNNPEIGITFSDQHIHDENNNFLFRINFSDLSYNNLLNYKPYMSQPSAFIKTAVFAKIGGFDPAIKLANDHELWLRVFKNFSGFYECKNFGVAIEHPSTLSNRHRLRALYEVFKINRTYKSRFFSRANYFLLRTAIIHLLKYCNKRIRFFINHKY